MSAYELLLKNPAEEWENSTPIGNGRLGVSVFGRTDTEILQLNEENLWDSEEQDIKKGGEGFFEEMQKLREMLLTPVEEDTDYEKVDADAYADKHLDGRFYRLKSFESAGEMKFNFAGHDEISDYSRVLDMLNGKAVISYTRGETKVLEEVFASETPSLIAVRYTAENGTLDFSLTYSRPLRTTDDNMGSDAAVENVEMIPYTTEIFGNCLFAESKTCSETHTMQLAAQLFTDGGIEEVKDGWAVRGAKECILYIAIATDKEAELPEDLSAAAFHKLYENNRERFSEIMGRSHIDFEDEREAVPVDERLFWIKENGKLDVGLLSRYYTFGRYLLLSSSYGKDGMPANLQGIWNPYQKGPWNSNYTININLEMNYWPAETANLSECTAPLFRYLTERLMPKGREVAREFYHCRGMVAHHISDIYGFALPGDGVWGLWPMGGAWLAYAMWEHYLFTKDEDFLRDTAYSYIKECVQFFLDYLFEHPRYPGRLLSGPSSSPENAYYRMPDTGKERFMSHICISPTMDNQIIGGLFEMYEKMEELLQLDVETYHQVKDARPKLVPLQIGSDGRLLEWMEEFEECEPGHRHVSHAFGLYPGWQISEDTLDFMEAIKKTLEKRLENGGGHTGWSCAWLICLSARLHDPEMTEDMLMKLFTKSTKSNLFDSHPPFQIDGNFGAAAGIAEMLVQSHTGKIVLLPALPQTLKNGSFTGIMARGGLEVSAEFTEGRVTNLNLYAKCSGVFTLVVNGDEFEVEMKRGEKMMRAL